MREIRVKTAFLGDYMDGQFVLTKNPNGEWTDRSPADQEDQLAKVFYSYAAVETAVAAAKKAFSAWRKKKPEERANYLKKYQEILLSKKEELAEVIAREVGKPYWEALGEVKTMVNKVDITLQESAKLIQSYRVPQAAEGAEGACHYRALGVMAVIGPFNFPAHLPNGHIVPALYAGDTVIFKPSEKAPLVGQLIAQCMHEAGLPAGVFNLVQGEREVGRRLCVHEGVDGVLFTGSYEVGLRIKQDTLQQHWKILALEMGGKNSAIVWDDAQFDYALHETLTAAYLTAGQRCTSTSRIIVHQSLLDRFIEKFHERAKAFTIGHPLEDPFMGSLIDQTSVDRYIKFLGMAAREGCEVVMRGKALELKKRGNYVSPSICWVKDASVEAAKKSVYQQTELFAPNVAILGVQDIDHAIALANVTQYGLAASVFTQARPVFDHCCEEILAGVLNWNRSTVGASSRLPFGGFKKSGNHFPTALTSTLYCTAPVASLEVQSPKLPAQFAPGLNWAN